MDIYQYVQQKICVCGALVDSVSKARPTILSSTVERDRSMYGVLNAFYAQK